MDLSYLSAIELCPVSACFCFDVQSPGQVSPLPIHPALQLFDWPKQLRCPFPIKDIRWKWRYMLLDPVRNMVVILCSAHFVPLSPRDVTWIQGFQVWLFVWLSLFFHNFLCQLSDGCFAGLTGRRFIFPSHFWSVLFIPRGCDCLWSRIFNKC